MSTQPIIIERILDAPLEKVWKAMTDNQQIRQWYFHLEDFKAERGFEFRFEVEHEGNKWKHICKVQEVLPYKKLSYTWRYDGYDGESLVSWELLPEGDQTRLKLTHSGTETFPEGIEAFAKQNFEAGWNAITGETLPGFVETAHINNVFEVNAPVSKIWKLFTDDNEIRKWATAFSEGTYSKSDWKNGSNVEWRGAGNELGARGKVVEREENVKIRISYYDNPEPVPGEQLGDYAESYAFADKNGVTTVTADSGPLQLKYVKQHTPMWEKAISLIKDLAEK